MLSCHKRHNFREAETKKEIMGGNQALTQSAILHQGTPRNLENLGFCLTGCAGDREGQKAGACQDGDSNKSTGWSEAPTQRALSVRLNEKQNETPFGQKQRKVAWVSVNAQKKAKLSPLKICDHKRISFYLCYIKKKIAQNIN